MNQEETKNWTEGFQPIEKESVPPQTRAMVERVFSTMKEPFCSMETKWEHNQNGVYVGRRGIKIIPIIPEHHAI